MFLPGIVFLPGQMCVSAWKKLVCFCLELCLEFVEGSKLSIVVRGIVYEYSQTWLIKPTWVRNRLRLIYYEKTHSDLASLERDREEISTTTGTRLR